MQRSTSDIKLFFSNVRVMSTSWKIIYFDFYLKNVSSGVSKSKISHEIKQKFKNMYFIFTTKICNLSVILQRVIIVCKLYGVCYFLFHDYKTTSWQDECIDIKSTIF